MTMSPNNAADLVRDINTTSEAMKDQRLRAYQALDAGSLKRMLTQSGAEVAFITSGYLYEHVIRRRPSLVDPALFQSLSVRVKETRTRAWAYVLGTLPGAGPQSRPADSGQVAAGG